MHFSISFRGFSNIQRQVVDRLHVKTKVTSSKDFLHDACCIEVIMTCCLWVSMAASNFYFIINTIFMLHPNIWKPCVRVHEINYWVSQRLWCRGTKTSMIFLSPDLFQLISNYDANSNLGTAKVSLTSSSGGEQRAAGWEGGQPAGVSGSTDSRRAILAGSASWPSTWT